jgi:hypothetical protein
VVGKLDSEGDSWVAKALGAPPADFMMHGRRPFGGDRTSAYSVSCPLIITIAAGRSV